MSYPTWRGDTVCTCMSAPLDELARLITVRTKQMGMADWTVTPIPGFGSYQNGTTASGSTATGGGHIDISMVGRTPAQKALFESTAREIGWLAILREPTWWSAWFGKWLHESWESHCHMLLVGCPHLSAGAKAQIAEWDAGENGLVGHDKDTGIRTYVGRTYAVYLAIKNAASNILNTTSLDAQVRLVQQALRLTVDGKWGPETESHSALFRGTAVQGQKYFTARTITEKKFIQAAAGTTQDSIWGPATAAAVKATIKTLQVNLGVASDGVWGPVTDKAFLDLRAKAYKPVAPPAPVKTVDKSIPYGAYPWPKANCYYGPSVPGKPWFSGGYSDSHSLSLANIQAHIKQIQKYCGVPQTGHYDAATVAGVKRKQALVRVSIDGIVGPTTWTAFAKSRGQ